MACVRFERLMDDGTRWVARVEVPVGANLRRALLDAGTALGSTTPSGPAAGVEGPVSPHNAAARWVNCRGFGTCGTCAVEVLSGEVEPPSVRESWRLDFPPHVAGSHGGRLRLACRLTVKGDMVVRKHPGFWGQEEVREGEGGAELPGSGLDGPCPPNGRL